jgi:hypothetical protein
MIKKSCDYFEPKSIDDLNDCQKKQLKVAGKLYDGGDYSAEERISFEGSGKCETGFHQSFPGLIFITSIFDKDNKPAYDVMRLMADSGTIFKTGTTEVAAFQPGIAYLVWLQALITQDHPAAAATRPRHGRFYRIRRWAA